MEGVVRLTDQARMDSRAGHDRADMADYLSRHLCHVLLRVCAGREKEGALDGGFAVRHQPCGQPDFHANSVWPAEPAIGCLGYRHCVGHDHLDDGGSLAALQMGSLGSSAVFGLGVDCVRAATVDHLLELGQMILRLSQKLNTKIKAGKLAELPLDENPYADWSNHLFTADRTQYIILMNTASLYACVMYGRGITDGSTFIARALETIREFAADNGQQFIYRKFIEPSAGTVRFAKALNRSVTGSMTDHIHAAKFMLENDMAPNEIGYHLNKTPMSALVGQDGRKYGYPKEVFSNLVNRIAHE